MKSDFLEYARLMIGCYAALSKPEQQELERWEASPQFTCTSGWPGWEKYIGKSPRPPKEHAR